jgi:tRNA(Ile)-lysidine synthase TilS/MesJ
MCNLCSSKPVYEFTNKRKLCKTCFIDYFQKKVLYTIRKFGMIKPGDVIEYKKESGFKGAVLSEMLRFIATKMEISLNLGKTGKAGKGKKIASTSSLDSEADDIVKTLINGNASGLKKFLPVVGNVIKPLYLFLDEEILLFARLKNLKFKQEKTEKQTESLKNKQVVLKKDKIKKFEDEFEKKHPEVKRAIVNSILELYIKEE